MPRKERTPRKTPTRTASHKLRLGNSRGRPAPASLPDTFVRREKWIKSVKQKSTVCLFCERGGSGKEPPGGERGAGYPGAKAAPSERCLCRGDHGGQSGRAGRDECRTRPNAPRTRRPEPALSAS